MMGARFLESKLCNSTTLYLVMGRDGVYNDGDKDVHENEGAEHHVRDEEDDRHRRVRSAADHVRFRALRLKNDALIK